MLGYSLFSYYLFSDPLRKAWASPSFIMPQPCAGHAVQGVDDANTATAAENLATALGKKGEFEEARRLMQARSRAPLSPLGVVRLCLAISVTGVPSWGPGGLVSGN